MYILLARIVVFIASYPLTDEQAELTRVAKWVYIANENILAQYLTLN